ncbi:hypothetical protein EON82_10435 [bacterium]|nr:MAG: hypothetical protein EON82_10435 [bacterium]
MLLPLTIPFAFLTWRECVVGLKPTELVQMDIRRTWDIRPKNIPSLQGNALNQPVQFEKLGGGVNSETVGFVRWQVHETTLFDKPCRLLKTEAYDKKAQVLVSEEVWVDYPGNIVRQREERETNGGKQTSDAAFYPDRIELSRVDARRRTTFGTLYPSGGMEELQRRFKPLENGKKEFVRLNGIDGSLVKVSVEKAGRFRGSWNGDKYEGASFRYTVDGKEQTAMLTPEDETVQVQFSSEVQLVLSVATKSRRKGGL